MRIWIDTLTPKQANLFSVLVSRLAAKRHEVLVTTRRYREVEQLLQIRGTKATILGSHGGPGLQSKLVASSKRITELAGLVNDWNPDIAISYCSPEAARVAYGLRVPHYAICDSPHAEAVCRLVLPLSKKLFTPKAIPKIAWRRYGVCSSEIVQYDALDPVVWIREYAPPSGSGKMPAPGEEKPLVLLRPEEDYASYLLTATTRRSIITQLARSLNKLGAQVVVLPRYERQVEMLTKELAGVASVPPNVVDALELLAQCSAFIGAGGTMCAEAALMGIPTISCYPSEPTYVDKFLFRLRLAERVLSADRALARVRKVLKNPKLAIRQKERAEHVLAKMEDPLRAIMTDLGL